MFVWEDFEGKLNDFYEFVFSEFDSSGGLSCIKRGDTLYAGDIQSLENRGAYNKKWWYVDEPCKEIVPFHSYEDHERLKELVELAYAEHHNNMAYFSDYADHNSTEFEHKFYEELTKYYSDEDLNMYEGDFSWLLDGYAIKELMPRLFEKFTNTDS